MINLLALSTGLIVGIFFCGVAVVALAVLFFLLLRKPHPVELKLITVSYETNGGDEIEKASGEAGEFLPARIPIRHGYLFNGWYEDETLQVRADASVFPEKDMTFYAEWKEYGDKESEKGLESEANVRYKFK